MSLDLRFSVSSSVSQILYYILYGAQSSGLLTLLGGTLAIEQLPTGRYPSLTKINYRRGYRTAPISIPRGLLIPAQLIIPGLQI